MTPEELEKVGGILLAIGSVCATGVLFIGVLLAIKWARETHGEASGLAIALAASLVIAAVGVVLIAAAKYRGGSA